MLGYQLRDLGSIPGAGIEFFFQSYCSLANVKFRLENKFRAKILFSYRNVLFVAPVGFLVFLSMLKYFLVHFKGLNYAVFIFLYVRF